ncbi:hypothetical protein B0533_11640 [Sedimentibacter sp. SX930]|nr:hypothetical protein B0533_11640 [Sedimentibacter sp. SX930]
MLAGGGCIAGGRTPAKPPWSEVIVFLDVFHRREDHLSEVTEKEINAKADGLQRLLVTTI